MTGAPTGAAARRRAPLDLSLYLVTDAQLCGDTGVVATVAAAVHAGVTAVQLRDPTLTDAELVVLGRDLHAALVGTGVPLLVNDRVHLVEEIGADGAHVGQDDLDVGQARAVLGNGRYLGLSVWHQAQVGAAAGQDLDYLGVGPVWPTSTKPGHAVPTGVEHLRRIVRASPWPCVAIGSVTVDRVREVRECGVAGIAVISAVCGQPDAGVAARRLRQVWEERS